MSNGAMKRNGMAKTKDLLGNFLPCWCRAEKAKTGNNKQENTSP